MSKIVITCAVTGAETTREQNPNLPITPGEIATAAAEARQAGAAILHLHARDGEGEATSDLEIFRAAIQEIRAATDIVIEVTTGGAVGMSIDERLAVLDLEPEMASLDCGTVNFGDEYIVNALPDVRRAAAIMQDKGVRATLECFDLSHIDTAALLLKEKLISPPLHYGLVLGVPGAVRYDDETLDFFVKRLPPGASWTAIGIGGRGEMAANTRAIATRGHVRVGFEDNIWFEKNVLAESNAQLVARVAKQARDAGREIAAPADVRALLALKEK
jgi:3-keto-5-aminohexanoate cleavage enzyme